ncbi:MAG TPA: HIT domain-containing protein [Burkholderiaceae bacterium]|nr:HIT domain-containing protein [Burkholderiaceae bacterium]
MQRSTLLQQATAPARIGDCPFCRLPEQRIRDRNDRAVVVRDAYPVTPGHTLVIPTRHIASFFDTTAAEREALLSLLDAAREQLQAELRPDGFNIGINDGRAAGQTIGHLHIHLIPRYAGDLQDPRGGVRWIIPEKAAYWLDEPADGH